MTKEDAFIWTILANPDDETSRLVYADWLEEHGDARGEVIRGSCKIAGLPEGDPHRRNLVEIIRELREQHRDEWIEHCGLLLTLNQALALFERRLAEVVAWYHGRNPGSLRTPTLRPPPLVGTSVFDQGRWVWTYPTRGERQRIVNSLANRREQLLSEEGVDLRKDSQHLSEGRLLLFDPDGTLNDGAAESESEGYFDIDNVPAWDTWVILFNSYLVAWVPPQWVERVSGGNCVNPEECIRWASDVDTALTRKLREAGLLV